MRAPGPPPCRGHQATPRPLLGPRIVGVHPQTSRVGGAPSGRRRTSGRRRQTGVSGAEADSIDLQSGWQKTYNHRTLYNHAVEFPPKYNHIGILSTNFCTI